MRTVITYGTFDLFHNGHYNILKRAKEQGDYLIVGVTSESYDTDRGKLSVHDSLSVRIENVQKTGFADKIIVEEYLGQKIKDIIKYNVDVLVVGSDWIGKFDHLRQYCDVVYLERTKNISSTQIRESMSELLTMGIITENEDDNDFVLESKYVSGVHVDSVFCRNIDVAQKCAEKYQLNRYFNKLSDFFDTVGIVYIKAGIGSRYEYIKEALQHKKHVICDFPFTYDSEDLKELRRIAERNHVILLENIVTIYLKGFIQLIWLLRSQQIGRILEVDASISADKYEYKDSNFDDLLMLPLCSAVKVLGTDIKSVDKRTSQNDEKEVIYGTVDLKYTHAKAHLQVGTKVPLDNYLTIIGDKGTVEIYDDWWNTGYYKIKKYSDSSFKRYCFNFEGNGLRYIIQELMIMINDNRTIGTRLFDDEADLIVKLLKQ